MSLRRVRRPARAAALCLALGIAALLGRPAGAAETAPSGSPAPGKTVLVLKLAAKEALDIRTAFQENPPTLSLEFPARRVVASLPDRSVLERGIIQEIAARYDPSESRNAARFLQGLDIRLTAPYAYQVRSEAGRVIVEITHPSAAGPEAFEVGLSGGTIIHSLRAPPMSDRFRAMQEAMAKATPKPWTLRWSRSSEPAAPRPAPQPAARPAVADRSQERALATAPASASFTAPSPAPARQGEAWTILGWLAVGMIGAGIWWLAARSRTGRWGGLKRIAEEAGGRASSAMALMEQLVWQAFERQGYQLVRSVELQRPAGTLRIIVREGAKAGLLCVGNGPFYEKQSIERFVAALHAADVERGFLAASGAFTVPAQRLAKDHQVALIGRAELVELLSAGATSEYVAKQLEYLQVRLDEAKETLRQYAGELDTLRRQRNEASWYLGEERARSGKLEAEFEALRQELRQQDADVQRWEQEAVALRKHWEESEWYLGESKARVGFLDSQVAALQEAASRAEVAEHDQEDLTQELEDQRLRTAALEAQVRGLQQALAKTEYEAQTWKSELDALKGRLDAAAESDERRRFSRRQIPEALVELSQDGQELLFKGPLRDLSGMGIGLDSEREIPSHTALRARLLLPGFTEPIESKARVIWQRMDVGTTRYQSGCRLLGLTPTARRRIDELVQQSPS